MLTLCREACQEESADADFPELRDNLSTVCQTLRSRPLTT
jgi:hypothetical protein